MLTVLGDITPTTGFCQFMCSPILVVKGVNCVIYIMYVAIKTKKEIFFTDTILEQNKFAFSLNKQQLLLYDVYLIKYTYV